MLKSVCCMSLKTAGQIISWISLVVSLILTIIACLEINRINNQDFRQNFSNKHERQVVNCQLLTGFLLYLFFSGLLVFGTLKKHHLLFLPWLIYSVILLISVSVKLIFYCILYVVETPKYFFSGFGYFWLYLIPLVIGLYFIYVINSLYTQIRHSNKQKFPLIEATPLSNTITSGNAGFNSL